MSMDGDVGNAVGSAAMIGLAIGLQRQRDKAAGSWEHYAHQLEQQLNVANRLVDEKNNQIVALTIELRLKNELIAMQKEEAAARERKVTSESSRALSRGKKLWDQRNDTAVLHFLYEHLIDEINKISDPAKFTALDEAKREELIRNKFAEVDTKPDYDKRYFVELKPPKRPLDESPAQKANGS